jgi:hypothetical protein
MDLQVIANGLATTVGTVTATNGSQTESATATADLPNKVGLAALLVYPPIGTLNVVMGPRLDDQYDFFIKLLRDPVDMPDRTRWLYAWATALRGRVQTSWSLGISGVTQAQVTAMRTQIEGERYAGLLNTRGGDLFDVVELTVRVWVWELAVGVGP